MSWIKNKIKSYLYKSIPTPDEIIEDGHLDTYGLPDKYINILNLYIKGKTVKDIAYIVECDQKWVISVLRRLQFLGRC